MDNLTFGVNEMVSERIEGIKAWSDIENKKYCDAIENAKGPKDLIFAMSVPVYGFEMLDFADKTFEEMTEEEMETFNNAIHLALEGVTINGQEAEEWAKS